MLPDIKTILYATDLSPNARYAFGYVASMANQYNAKIIVLHVLEQLSETVNAQLASMMGEDRWRELQERNQQEVQSTIRERLDAFCEEMKGSLSNCPFIVADTVVDRGVPADRILHQVARTKCDLVVMGTRGQGMLADAMLGSTARRVVRRCLKPVMVIRLPES
ncbi:MAG: universal stress protein [Desulfobacterales bacterium]|jgi:nucleotide-binding universal stress UspA family protein